LKFLVVELKNRAEDGEEEEAESTRVTRRVTRFIDLAALNAGPGGTGSNVPKDKEPESELR